MDIPKLPQFETLHHLRAFYCNRIMPQLYDDSLSFQELIYAIFCRLNDCVETLNSFNDYIKKIEDLLIQFDKHLRDEVTKQLEIWYNDGTLQEILQEVSDDYFNELRRQIEEEMTKFKNQISEEVNVVKSDLQQFKNSTFGSVLSVSRIWRHLHQNGKNCSFLGSKDTNANNKTLTNYPVLQGITMCSHNGVNYYITLTINSTRQTSGTENTLLSIYKTSSARADRTAVLPLGHGQSVAYMNGYIYVCPSSLNQNQSCDRIYRVNFDNLQEYTYKAYTGKQPYCISMYNNKLYVVNGSERDKVYRLDNTSVSNIGDMVLDTTLPYGLPTGTLQGMLKTNFGFAYIVNSEIIVYNQNGTRLQDYYLPPVSNNGYAIGEPENIFYYGQRICIGSRRPLGATTNVAQLESHQVFYLNDEYTPSTTALTYNSRMARQLELQVRGVAGSKTIHALNAVTNPNGTESYPFACCQEAIDYYMALGYSKGVILNLLESDPYYCYYDGANAFIDGDQNGTGGVCYIGGARAGYGSDLTFRNVSLFNSNTSFDAPIMGYGANLRFYTSCTFHGTNPNTNFDIWHKDTYEINATLCVLLLSGTVSASKLHLSRSYDLSNTLSAANISLMSLDDSDTPDTDYEPDLPNVPPYEQTPDIDF